jgi:beta-1,4-mannosyl-glycoprotein beta-1,4-N-acetylglucosaminyltransferase
MIYDCVIFWKELHLLEMRMNILKDVVDKFVIVESDKTFTGNTKPLYFIQNSDVFYNLVGKDRIIHKQINLIDSSDPWILETQQRNSMMLDTYTNDDIIMMSDVDEIPDPKIIAQSRFDKEEIYTCKQNFFYYYLNNKLEEYVDGWFGTKICKGSVLKTYNPQQIRNINTNKFWCGWHFSYLGDEHLIREKIEAFSHQEYNTEIVKGKISNNISTQQDLFGRNILMNRVSIDESYPDYIRYNIDKYNKFIL